MEIQEKQNGHRHGNIPCQCPFYLVALFLLLIVPVQAIKTGREETVFFGFWRNFTARFFSLRGPATSRQAIVFLHYHLLLSKKGNA